MLAPGNTSAGSLMSVAATALDKAGRQVQAAGESVLQASTVATSAGRLMPVDRAELSAQARSVLAEAETPPDAGSQPASLEGAVVGLLLAETQYGAAAAFTREVAELGSAVDLLA